MAEASSTRVGGGQVGYERRRPEATVLYQVVADHLETFLAEARERTAHGFGVPRHVEKEFRRYLECGILAHGFARVHCADCGTDRLVAFSCKGRAICPSCRGRTMVDTAAHLVDRVLPAAAYRQWTFSLPWRFRLRLARDGPLLSKVVRTFLGAVFSWQRRRARQAGIRRPLAGGVTFTQRFGSVLNLNVHFHSVLPDGVFTLDEDGQARFVPLPPPDDAEVWAICARIAKRLLARFEAADGEEDADDEQTVLLPAESLSLLPSLAAGEEMPAHQAKRKTALVDGFSLHADAEVRADDRAALERLLRYGARPPFSHRRLTWTPSGKVAYQLRRPWYTGQTHVVLPPVAFLRRLSLLIPPPRQHQVRFHGVFAPNARERRAVVALVPGAGDIDAALPGDDGHASSSAADPETAPRLPARARLSWAALFARVFAKDVLTCPACAGRMRVIALVTDTSVAAAILTHLGLPTEVPKVAAARAPPELGLEFEFD